MTGLPGGVEHDPTRPWCGHCSDPEYRVIEVSDCRLIPCPDCGTTQLGVV